MHKCKSIKQSFTNPVTVLVAALLIGGIAYGISVPSDEKKASDKSDKTKAKTEKEVTPEYICYDKAGTYSDKATYTSGEITVDGVTVENATFDTLTVWPDTRLHSLSGYAGVPLPHSL